MKKLICILCALSLVAGIQAAKRGKRAVTDVTITRVSMMYDAESRSVYYGLHTDEFAPAFYFDIPVAEGARDVEPGKTYSLAEMNAEYCEWDDDDWNAHYYTEAAFTKTRGNDHDIHISANVKDTDGKEWSLHYDEAPLVVTGDTVLVDVSRPLNTCQYISNSGEWLLRARDNQWMVQLEFAATDEQSPAGEYGAEAITWSDTYVEYPTGGTDGYGEPEYATVYAKDGSMRAVSSREGQRLDVSATLLGEDGNVYAITLFYALPEKESEATLTSTNLSVDTWALQLWGEIEADASDEEAGWSIGLNLYPEDRENYLTTYVLGSQVTSNGSITVDGEQFAIYSGEVTLAYADERYTLTGTVLAWNNVEYTLQLSTPEPEVSELRFAGEDLTIDLLEGAWQIAGFDEAHENFLSIAVFADHVAGSYTEADMAEDYTYLAVGDEIYLLSTAAISVSYADSIAGVSGTMHLINQTDEYDHLELTLDLKAHPYRPQVYTLALADFAFMCSADGQDVFYQVMTEDGQRIFLFDILVEPWSADVAFGTTYDLSGMIEEESFGVDYLENTYVFYQAVSFTKAAAGDGQVTLAITVLDTRGNTWNLSYTGADKEIEGVMNVTLGQASPGIWDGGNGVEYEMVDKDNTISCYLVFDLPGKTDVEADTEYSSDDLILLDYSYLSVMKEEHKITAATFIKEQNGETVSITATIVDDRGYKFSLSYYDDGFRPTGDTVRLSIDEPLNVTYWDEYYEWVLYAEDETTIVSISLNGGAELDIAGDVTEDVSLWNSRIELLVDAESQSWDYIQLYSAPSVIVSGEDGNYALEATLIAENGITYLIEVNRLKDGVATVRSAARPLKRIVNGQLMIEKNGITYTVQGTELK